MLDGFQHLPLFHTEHTPDGEHHHSVFFFQFAARGEHHVNLRPDFGFIGTIGLDERLEKGFLALDVVLQVDELQAVLQEVFLDLRDLRLSELELADDVGILPPLAKVRLRWLRRLRRLRLARVRLLRSLHVEWEFRHHGSGGAHRRVCR